MIIFCFSQFCFDLRSIGLFSEHNEQMSLMLFKSEIKDQGWASKKNPVQFLLVFQVNCKQSNCILTTEQQYHQVGKLSPASPFCNNYADCIHLRALICPPFGQVTIYNTLYIMFFPTTILQRTRIRQLNGKKVAMTSNYWCNWMWGLEFRWPFLSCHCRGEGRMSWRLYQIN